MFIEFLVEKVLLKYTTFPRLRLVLVIDNTTIYYNREIIIIIREKGYLVEYLLPYLLDFNLIEATFSDLKRWIRRNYIEILEYKIFKEFLEYTI